jgi:hypothetical protein
MENTKITSDKFIEKAKRLIDLQTENTDGENEGLRNV